MSVFDFFAGLVRAIFVMIALLFGMCCLAGVWSSAMRAIKHGDYTSGSVVSLFLVGIFMLIAVGDWLVRLFANSSGKYNYDRVYEETRQRVERDGREQTDTSSSEVDDIDVKENDVQASPVKNRKFGFGELGLYIVAGVACILFVAALFIVGSGNIPEGLSFFWSGVAMLVSGFVIYEVNKFVMRRSRRDDTSRPSPQDKEKSE